MRWSELLYLVAVLAVGTVFGARSLSEAARALARGFGEDRFVAGAAGVPRDLDVERIRRLIRDGDLSDREALFWKEQAGRPSASAGEGTEAVESGRGGVFAARREIEVMGTKGVVTVVMSKRSRGGEARVLQAAEGALRRTEGLMSGYLADSEVSRLNAAGTVAVPLSEETLRVLAAARAIHGTTDGAFDVTCMPVIDLWRRAGKEGRLPSPEAIDEARRESSWADVELLPEGVFKRRASARVDLGGIAKGYALDRAIEEIRIAGCEGGIVEVGGDVSCFGRPAGGGKWRVAVRHPFEPAKAFAEIAIGSGAVCTSGDYERFFEIDGKRYSHIIDPRTGRPAVGAASVTVVAPAAFAADAWATALTVLGPSRLDILPPDRGVEALVVTGSAGKPEVRMTPGFRALLVRGPDF